jgi:histidyl-tRNA synthetase
VLIVGEDELAKGKGILRDMLTKGQMEISLENPVSEIIRQKEEG